MSTATLNVLAQPDLVELLEYDPELLAFADAIGQTQKRRLQRPRLARIALAAVITTGALVLALIQPWQSEPSLIDRALGAVGEGPVIHAVIRDETGWNYVDLATGRETPLLRTIEIWFDGQRHIEHTLVRLGSYLHYDMLETPSGATTSGGPVYTCAWIKAHPAEAARARVSCGPDAPTTPTPPQLNPALTDFVDGYRYALRSGRATELAGGQVDGHAVTWLRLVLPDGRTERVAIDQRTSQPVRVETNAPGSWRYDVVEIEALPEGAGDFSAPTPETNPLPSGGQMRKPHEIDASEAATTLPGALSAGSSVGGLELTKVVKATLTTGYGPSSDQPVTRSTGVEFDYGLGDPARGQFVSLQEAAQPEAAYGWGWPAPQKSGSLLIGGWGGLLVKNGIYVMIKASDRNLMLAAARALRPVAAGQ